MAPVTTSFAVIVGALLTALAINTTRLFVVARALYVLGMLTRPTSMPMRIGAGGTYLLEIVLLSLLLGARLG